VYRVLGTFSLASLEWSFRVNERSLFFARDAVRLSRNDCECRLDVFDALNNSTRNARFSGRA
jgi:hypothetical protein